MPLDFAEPLLIRTVTCTKRVCHLHYYSQVGVAYIIVQTISSLTVSITGLPMAHSNGVAYQDVKEPRYIIATKKKKKKKKKCNVSLYAECLELHHCK